MNGLDPRIIFLIVTIFVCMVLLALQLFLSTQKNKWLGLILPVVCLLAAFIGAFGLTIYTGDMASVMMTFFMFSVPAVINFAIYLACRARVKARYNKEMAK